MVANMSLILEKFLNILLKNNFVIVKKKIKQTQSALIKKEDLNVQQPEKVKHQEEFLEVFTREDYQKLPDKGWVQEI